MFSHLALRYSRRKVGAKNEKQKLNSNYQDDSDVFKYTVLNLRKTFESFKNPFQDVSDPQILILKGIMMSWFNTFIL